jgi:hypothetical protein
MWLAFGVTAFICESMVMRLCGAHLGLVEFDEGSDYGLDWGPDWGLFNTVKLALFFFAFSPACFAWEFTERFVDNLWIPNKKWP